ncbi:MAG: YbaK/EbsC family protein [Candidatus Acidiferrales bacterium]
MTIPAQLKSHLAQAHVSYSPIYHLPKRAAQFTAAVLQVPGKEVAKTVAFRAGDTYLLAVLPASSYVDLKKLGGAVGMPVQLLNKEECGKLFTDYDVSAIPPFGELYGLPVYMDQALADNPEIIFNAGTRFDSIQMGNVDFVRLVKPHICSFAEKS